MAETKEWEEGSLSSQALAGIAGFEAGMLYACIHHVLPQGQKGGSE